MNLAPPLEPQRIEPQVGGGINLPNRLTISRFLLTVAFVAALSIDSIPYKHTLALVLFVVAAITDYFDGEIARRYSLITDFGRLMDPLVDKIMTASAFICLVPLKAIPAWVAIIVISREFLITGLRLLAVSKGRILAAERIGKHKTSWQIATVIYFLGLLSFWELSAHLNPHSSPYHALESAGLLWTYGGWAVSGIAIILTIYSGVGYIWKNRGVIETG